MRQRLVIPNVRVFIGASLLIVEVLKIYYACIYVNISKSACIGIGLVDVSKVTGIRIVRQSPVLSTKGLARHPQTNAV